MICTKPERQDELYRLISDVGYASVDYLSKRTFISQSTIRRDLADLERAGLSYIPTTNTRGELTGAVLEVMSAVSYNTVVPAFFDVALTLKVSRDTESEQMIPIINESASFYDEATGFDVIGLITSGSALPTYYAGVKNQIEDNVQKQIVEVYK